MKIVPHSRTDGRFLEIKCSLNKKKSHRTNQGFNFFGGSFSNGVHVKTSIQLEEKKNANILKADFSSRIELFKWPKSFLVLKLPSQVPHRLDSSYIKNLITITVESCITSIESNITGIIRKINVEQE